MTPAMLAAMRSVDEEAQRLIDYSNQLRPAFGSLGLGKDGIYEGLCGWALRAMLRDVFNGTAVEVALERATAELIAANKRENARHPDYMTERWERNGVNVLEWQAGQLNGKP